MRTGLLSDELLSRGHHVVWWSTNFDHRRKIELSKKSTSITVRKGFRVKLLKGIKYKRHLSILRYLHYKITARKFIYEAKKEIKPDIIIVSLPTHDFSYKAVLYAKKHKIPVYIDIRDLWPEVFIDKIPYFKMLGRLFFAYDFYIAKKALTNATGLLAVSQGYLNWGLKHAGRGICNYDKMFYIGSKKSVYIDEKVSKKIRNLLNNFSEKKLCVYVGTFGESYDLSTVINTAKRFFNNNCHSIHFVLIGDGLHFKNILEQSSVYTNITLTGWLESNDISAVLSRSYIGLIPCLSVLNTVPNKPFEYLAFGLPILSSLIGEMEAIINDCNIGINYKQKDEDSLYNSIIKICENQEMRDNMARNARNYFKSRCNADNIYSEYANHIECSFNSN